MSASQRNQATIVLSRRALRDILNIEEYSVTQWGEKVAGEYLDQIEAGLQRIAASPELLREDPEIATCLRFYRVQKHLLICDVVGRSVYVLAVIHCSMDVPRRIRELEPILLLESEMLHQKLQKKQAEDNQ